VGSAVENHRQNIVPGTWRTYSATLTLQFSRCRDDEEYKEKDPKDHATIRDNIIAIAFDHASAFDRLAVSLANLGNTFCGWSTLINCLFHDRKSPGHTFDKGVGACVRDPASSNSKQVHALEDKPFGPGTSQVGEGVEELW